MEMDELVAAAKKRSGKALEEIYKRTNQTAYYTALTITKNAEDASDIVQDTYINVFSNIDTIDNNSFINYLKMSVANACKNSLKKKHAILFCNDEEESNALNGIEEQSEDFLPSVYIEQVAKRKQIMSIINNLSDVQRATILFYYYDEMSIKEIAEAMECNESTVKSRIAYAKKRIKDEVLKLEQQGDKLYGKAFIPVPFLRKLFAEDSKNHKIPEAAAKTIFHNVISSVAGSTGMGSFVASSLFAKFAGLTTLAKAAIAAAGTAVIVGGSIAGAAVTGHLNNNQVNTAAVATSSSKITVSSVSSQIASSSFAGANSSVVSSAASSAAVSTASSTAAAAQKTPAKPAPPKTTGGVAPSTKKPSGGVAPGTKKPSGGTTGGTANTQPTSPTGAVAGNDGVANAKWLVSNLGFRQGENPQGAYYNPDNAAVSLALITVSHVNGCNCMLFRQWGGRIDSVSKGLLSFYLPNSHTKLYNMLNAWSDGSDEFTGKHYNMDGRDVVFYWYESSGKIQLQISDKR